MTKEQFIIFINQLDVKDLRVHVAEDGTISFQGVLNA